MIIKTGLEPYVSQRMIYPGVDRHVVFAGPEQEIYPTIPVPDLVTQETWVISFRDQNRVSAQTLLTFREPKVMKKMWNMLIFRYTSLPDEGWEHLLEDKGAPDDAIIESLPDEWTDAEKRTATWWEVEL